MHCEIHVGDDTFDSVRETISRSPPGRYRISDLLTTSWTEIEHKTRFGSNFRRLVEDGAFPGIQIGCKTDQKHQAYWVD